ncbi:hypothetical protein SCANM63S_02327 [Streptomyces canarius]
MSYGFTTKASSPSSSYAPASRDSTSAQPPSETTGTSLATRFMPSRMGFTSATSASRYAARERAKSSFTCSTTGVQPAVPNRSLISSATCRTCAVYSRYTARSCRDG